MSKKKGTQIINRIHQLEDQSPPISPTEALRRNLMYAMLNGVSELDVEEIVKKQAGKAKGGDTRAAKLIIDMIREGREPQVTHMQQAVVVNEDRRRFLSDTREQMAIIIGQEGPKQSAQLAKALYAPLPHILEALNDHAWFEKQSDGWHITQECRTAMIGTSIGADKNDEMPT